ncbi:2-amino-4-hydroxy-6-hydroxymethyldihydropteridine diphosphokinase [Miniphocaeibacter massiliensis]|uniref:2-amino-4-hydroxy-6- hydroxymethyldihydropteridine diphosphokinase n=1 Tax=Miniphocaeibacter massiliensis TaxID=2041841 RepID=UPI000C1C08B9|nr:2-amino-4-hydroxy-6-hydroxymethyldihydropteridine diphosphokinase [Miniphocaeibacter massiliensis]
MISFIALGSNIGERKKYIKSALDLISKRVGKILKESSVIETEPYGYTEQENFLNLVIKVETDLSPRELLNELMDIERELDRVRKITWGPRTIDLDIIYYEDKIVDEVDLHIPHIDIYNRNFVLGPLVEIEEEFVDPRKMKSVKSLLNELKNKKETSI